MLTPRQIRHYLTMTYGAHPCVGRFVAMLERYERYRNYTTIQEVGKVYCRYLRQAGVVKPGMGAVK